MSLTINATCTYCNTPLENIVHYFIECPAVIQLWKEIEYWPNALIGDFEKIFGYKTNNCIINRTIIATRQSIKIDRKVKNTTLNEVKRRLSYQMQSEEFIALRDNKEIHFFEVRNNMFNELSNI